MAAATGIVREVQEDGAELEELLSRRAGDLFAILDACDEPLVPPLITKLGAERAASLYRGRAAAEYSAIAPYLVQVDRDLLEWIMTNLVGKPWGVFAVAHVDLAALRRHFRQFLMVTDPNGDSLYFRFYDPRVLVTFLSTCNAADQRRFMGPVETFYVPGA